MLQGLFKQAHKLEARGGANELTLNIHRLCSVRKCLLVTSPVCILGFGILSLNPCCSSFHHMVEQSTCLCVLWEENGAGRSAMILTNYGPGSKDPMANLRFYFSNPFYQLSYHLNHCTKRADDAQHRLVGQGVCFCVVSTMTTVSYLAQI